MWRALLALAVFAGVAGAAAAESHDTRGIDPNQGLSLVEVDVASKAAAMRLQLDAESYGVEFNDHYLRSNPDGSFTVTVFGDEDGLAELHAAGYDLGVTIEVPTPGGLASQSDSESSRLEDRADLAALDEGVGVQSHEDEIVVLRVDYFENYAGRFLSVEVKDRLGSATPTGSTYVGPALSSPGTRELERRSTPRRGR